jgi:hypothetical protein
MSGNYQVSSITALILLVPSLLFMLVIHKFMRPEMLSNWGKGKPEMAGRETAVAIANTSNKSLQCKTIIDDMLRIYGAHQ